LFYRRAIPQGFVPLLNEEWLLQSLKSGIGFINTKTKQNDLMTIGKIWSVPSVRAWVAEDLQPVYEKGETNPIAKCLGNVKGALAGNGSAKVPTESEQAEGAKVHAVVEKDTNCNGKIPLMDRAVELLLPTVIEMMRTKAEIAVEDAKDAAFDGNKALPAGNNADGKEDSRGANGDKSVTAAEPQVEAKAVESQDDASKASAKIPLGFERTQEKLDK
jgi:hypothetical protein